MKDFLKMTLAVICGLVVTTVILCIIGFGTLGALLAAGSSTPVLPKEGVLTLDMSKIVLAEQSTGTDPFSAIAGGSTTTIGIWDAVQAVNRAASDPTVQYIYLRTDNSASGLSGIEELRDALENFRTTSGKAVVSYLEFPSLGGYYLASVADKVYMSSYLGATPMMTGVSAQMTFLGDLLSRLGINVQLIRHGKYKSAGEMYTRSSSSPENREQYQRMVDSMWETMSGEIALSRDFSVEQLDDAIDNLRLNLPQDFIDYGLADELLTREGLEQKLATLAVEEDIKDVKFIPFADYVAASAPVVKSDKEIAVIYADGEIVDGGSGSDVDGSRFASIISRVRADSTVKAVVLRVNSPGGSVIASEKIKHELDRLAEVKPLIASYGGYAASGGYWISNNCDKIYSDATTLTGSIGVFGMIPDFSGLANDKLHVNIETVSSGSHGDMFSGMKALDKTEYDFMQRSIESIYDKFTTTVSEGRGIPRERVDEIGQGRVWTGADAMDLHLVDEIGTLEDAVNYAALCAGDVDLSNWRVTGYPRAQTQMEQILEMFSGSSDEEGVLLGEFRRISEPTVMARMDTRIEICAD